MRKEIPPFSFSAGERKIMVHFVVKSVGRISTDVDTSVRRFDIPLLFLR
jgi:hypothetical protein